MWWAAHPRTGWVSGCQALLSGALLSGALLSGALLDPSVALSDTWTNGYELMGKTWHDFRCGDDRIDRVLYRSSESVTLTPLQWWIPLEFTTADGTDLSDHKPVAVRFRWQRN